MKKILFIQSIFLPYRKIGDKSLNYCPVNLDNWDKNIFYKHQKQYSSFDKEFFSLAVTVLGKMKKNYKNV